MTTRQQTGAWWRMQGALGNALTFISMAGFIVWWSANQSSRITVLENDQKHHSGQPGHIEMLDRERKRFSEVLTLQIQVKDLIQQVENLRNVCVATHQRPKPTDGTSPLLFGKPNPVQETSLP